MAREHLGDGFDVHGGGLDLVFPHHENERAQSEGAGAHPFARRWLHNGMLRLADEKMSKSLGNVERLRDALDRVGRETLLAFFAGASYRMPDRLPRTHAWSRRPRSPSASARRCGTRGATRGRRPPATTRASRRSAVTPRPRSMPRSPTTSTPPRRSRCCTGSRAS